MLFSSISFLYFFLPVTLIVYFVTPVKWRNVVLLIFSLLFYFSGEPIYTLLLIFSSVVDYCHSLIIEKNRGKKAAKAALISSICINLAMLAFFKYSDFFIENINLLFHASIPLLNIPLPLGISFFTFQTMSYTIDVYRGTAHSEKNFLSFATYVCLFPQLIAGPIVRYVDVAEELKSREHSFENTSLGIRRFIVGLSKKVLLANVLGEFIEHFKASEDKSVLFYWLYAIAFTLHIYFDFSGYSDMAIGLGRIFGFKFPENFNYPYISKTVTEFWRRWHITLGAFFRDYVYIPLGGNRVSFIKWMRNVFVVWLLNGMWHGAAWNFIVFGLIFGVFLTLEKLFIKKLLDKCPAFVSHIYTLLVVMFAFVIFNADSLTQAGQYFAAMFGAGSLPFSSFDTLYYLRSYAVVFVVGVIGSTPLVKTAFDRLSAKVNVRRILNVAEPVVVCALLAVSTAFLVDGSFNPFLYFRF